MNTGSHVSSDKWIGKWSNLWAVNDDQIKCNHIIIERLPAWFVMWITVWRLYCDAHWVTGVYNPLPSAYATITERQRALC